ncbi:MAG: S8 family serine peptidase [Candidatus Schekmanbacteria bacterium]|nr:S8 family serine peptidase [Candidatus Schekmanbacteria bacterium]
MKSFRLLTLFTFAVSVVFDAGAAQAGQPDPNRVIVKFKNQTEGEKALKAAGGKKELDLEHVGAAAFTVPPQALNGLRNHPEIEYIEDDPPRYPLAIDSVTPGAETSPYGIAMVQANLLSDAAAGTRKVCIIDSGFSQSHEDLQDSGVTSSYNSGTGDPFTDPNGHGTHVAGTIAGLGGNNEGVVGVNPSGVLKIHIVKVFGEDGWAYTSTLSAAANECGKAGANVISMSLGGGGKSRTEESTFSNLASQGILSIAAAGNDGTTGLSYPASYPIVLSVAAIDANKVVADFSQKNAEVDISAPGVAVLSSVPWREDTWVTVGGTNYAGNPVEGAARTAGTTGALVFGGLCDAAGSWSGKVVLCDRGSISFNDKVTKVKSGGGVAAVIANNVANEPLYATLGDGVTSTIPAIGITQEDGTTLKGKLGSSVTVVNTKVYDTTDTYQAWDGTSMATPHVAGVAALVWSYNPVWTATQVRAALEATAQDLGTAGRDNSYGYGLVQAKAAVDYLQAGGGGGGGGGGGADTTPPVISGVTSAKTSSSGQFSISWTTDENANTEIKFTSGCKGKCTFRDTALSTAHSMTFNGSNGTSYSYSVSSTDAAGNKATAGSFTHNN